MTLKIYNLLKNHIIKLQFLNDALTENFKLKNYINLNICMFIDDVFN